jgi:hypothetical protein
MAHMQLSRGLRNMPPSRGKVQSQATTPHTATQLPYDPALVAGGPAATNVQDAIDELAGEIGGATGFDVTPPLSVALPAFVRGSADALVPDPMGRLGIKTGAAYKSFPGACFLEGRMHVVYRSGTDHITSVDGVIRYTYSDRWWDASTWSTAVTIASSANDSRDPSILAASSGRLIVGYVDHPAAGPVNDTIKVIYSDNRGQSWSSAYDVPTTSLAYEAAQTSQMVELPDGTILMPGFGKNASGDDFYTVLWRSTDNGATFGDQVTIATGANNYVEPQIRLLASGKLVCLSHGATNSTVYRQVSTDAGLTWSAATSVLTAAGRSDFVEIWPSVLVLFCRTNQTDLYLRMTISRDEGVTWDALSAVDGFGSTDVLEYSAPVVLAPGYIVNLISIQNSTTDADIYLRSFYWGYGTDPLGNIVANSISIGDPTSSGHWEVEMAEGFVSPPDPVTTEDGTDWVYGWVSD